MNAVARFPIQTARFEIRTFDGKGQAVSHAFSSGRPIEVGYDLNCDVVIRDRRLGERRLSIKVGEDAATVEVLAGDVGLLGHKVVAPAKLLLPPYMPLDLGGVLLAYGECDGLHWDRAEALVDICLRDGIPAAAQRRTKPSSSASESTAARRKMFAGAILLGLTGLAVASWLVVALNPPSPTLSIPKTAAEVLTENGFGGLSVRMREGRTPVVSGTLPSDEAALRLRSTLKAQGVEAKVAITTGDGLAREVEDVFRSGGVPATAHHADLGRIVVTLPATADPWIADLLLRRAQATISKSNKVEVSRQLSTPDSASAGPGDGKPRITELYSGDKGFVSMSDGGRYFVGAILPTGQRIVSISTSSVELEEFGIITNVNP